MVRPSHSANGRQNQELGMHMDRLERETRLILTFLRGRGREHPHDNVHAVRGRVSRLENTPPATDFQDEPVIITHLGRLS